MIFLKEAARLFNSKELSRFADGNLELLEKVASRYQESLGDFFCAKDVFELCYKDFERNYKNEYLFKNIIAKKILLGRHSLKTATMLSELRVGHNKADCVILNGISTCYEIKSEYDNLSRLQEQLDSYLRVHMSHVQHQPSSAIHIRHFCSTSQPASPSNPGGKFLEALNDLIAFDNSNPRYFDHTWGLSELRNYHAVQHFPGLGVVKQLSVEHYMETICNFI